MVRASCLSILFKCDGQQRARFTYDEEKVLLAAACEIEKLSGPVLADGGAVRRQL
jgi:hypothetical protein